MSAASAAREASPDADITVFTEDEDIAYSPCAIPWGIEGRSQWDEIVMHTPQFYSEKRNIRVGTLQTQGNRRGLRDVGQALRCDELRAALEQYALAS